MSVICLTGGLAAGKSTAAKYFAAQGAHVIDADKLGHRTYEAGQPANQQIVEAFGEDVRSSDGSIDRKALGGKVFGQPDALKQLTDIVWPAIRQLAEAEIQERQSTNPGIDIVLEAAGLFEAGWEDLGDQTWVVVVEPKLATERAMARDGLPIEAVQNRLNSQLSNAERCQKADLVIENNADSEAFRQQLEKAWNAR